MNEFVDECRREWRRLGVPDAIANEMAADLTADLDEAQAEGGSPEDVLGNSAFDPRRFAASWAVARGVVGPPTGDRSSRWRPTARTVVGSALGVLAVIVGLLLLVGARGRSISIAVHRAIGARGPIQVLPFSRGRPASVGPFGPGFPGAQVNVASPHPVALLLVALGIVALGILVIVRWSPWTISRRDRGDRGPRSPSWN